MFRHETVLKKETIDSMQIHPDGIYVDCTLGGAGHSESIADRLSPSGTLIGLDQDRIALSNAKQHLSNVECNLHLMKANFRHIQEVVNGLGIKQVDGILFDLGVSSPQLDEGERGFSYHQDAPLDMRMDMEQELSAYHVVNEWPEDQIIHILRAYGEEKFSKGIARGIMRKRETGPIQTTMQLVETIKHAMPPAARWAGTHPARRSFQAIRIAVNDELGVFQSALRQAVDLLKPGGRICVITFHSLEDRICKKFFQELAVTCTCDPKIPICVCNVQPVLELITKKPIVPTEIEIERNKRARSSKLRVAEKR